MDYSSRVGALCLALLTPWQVHAQVPSAQQDASPPSRTGNAHLPVIEPQSAPGVDADESKSDLETPEQACFQAHEQGQLLRIDGKLLESRQRLKACSLEVCPAVVQRDCVRWLDEVASQIPTVVFEAVTEQGAAQRVTVRHAERVLTEELDGRPIELDPGYYEFVFEVPGREPVAVSTLLKQGEKNRLVSVDFWPAAPHAPVEPAVPVPPPAPATPPTVIPDPPPTDVSLAVYLLGGAAITSGAVALALALSTKAKNDSALDSCAPRCSEARIDEIKRSALFTDIALGAAALSALGAALLYAGHLSDTSNSSSAAYSLTLTPARGGLWTAFEGRF